MTECVYVSLLYLSRYKSVAEHLKSTKAIENISNLAVLLHTLHISLSRVYVEPDLIYCSAATETKYCSATCATSAPSSKDLPNK